MRGKIYGSVLALILIISTLTLFVTGFSVLHFLDALFMSSLFLLCAGLLLLLFSDGAFSIMGHSFRRFNYVMAPKRIRETMADDELYTRREVRIRNERYTITLPLIMTSLVCVVTALILSYLLK
ncbi:DUF3899 domain-containing protein [Macrococcus carouselicus]|uniref:DUF3899 domain-containing protein n=1 Tax=Macrococcus carouselicus TaxID=69969 RepID=A0A9Q8CJL1_9STAP|nr:DUF3899 domain-containing protein [Macrococcus carouselicus]TDM03790.1 DUF3899 domain-containing protein [Macrococcus carouselicus]